MSLPSKTPLTAEQWTRAREVFAAAMDADGAQRVALLDAQRQKEPIVYDEVVRLLQLSTDAGDFLEHPAATFDRTVESYTFSPGDLVADRFRITAAVGRGGMGEVYEAHDALLDEAVALKVLRRSSKAAAVDRFRQEVQLARRVSHQGICRVHDVAIHKRKDDELIVFTMELVRGETLAGRLGRGPLDDAEACQLARQLAAAVDAAHARGVLHGDIKPANVLLEPHPSKGVRAVITDFGLARAAERDAATGGGPILGTPAFMAPEQLRGELCAASDQFALAMMICEMVHARPSRVAPVGMTPDGAATVVLPALPEAWRAVFERALDSEPGRRFASAGDLVDRLWPRQAGMSRRTIAIGAAAALIFVALFAGAFRLYGRTAQLIGPAAELLLGDVNNATGDTDLDGIREVLRVQLAQSPAFGLVSTDRIAETLKQMRRDPGMPMETEVMREVAMRQGVPVVARASIERRGTAYVMSAMLERVGTTPGAVRAEATREFTAADRSGLFDAAHSAAVWIRETVGESAAELADQDRPPSDLTTASWQALRLFTGAERKIRAGQINDAVILLQEAIRIDAHFASAHRSLGDLLISTKRDREGYGAWRTAIALAEERQLTARESLRIAGQYYEDTGDLPAAEQAFRAYALHYPGDVEAAFFLGSVLVDRGRVLEAIPSFERALQLRPGFAAARIHLVDALREAGRIDHASEHIRVLRQQGHGEWARWLDALGVFMRGDIEGALRDLEPLRSADDELWRSRASTLRASWLAELGQHSAAAAELESGIRNDQTKGFTDRETVKRLHLAAIRLAEGHRSEAVHAATEVIDNASDLRSVMLAGTLMARSNRLDIAERAHARLRAQSDVPRVRISLGRLTGEMELARGKAASALSLCEAASRDARFQQPRTCVIRALIAAHRGPDAMRILDDWIAHPARYYAGPEPELPGALSNAREQRATIMKVTVVASPSSSARPPER
jgi:eukaryotic-like serine/threonine-protein kinase